MVPDWEVTVLIDVGSGPPLILIPGIQGRWEYQRPSIDALARRFRVLSFPLAGERGSDASFDPALGLDNYTRQIAAILDRAGVERATVCGVSFGGLVAVRFAAIHPDRTAALVLVSTPGPNWYLRPRHRVYASMPWLLGPLFLVEAPFRLRPELVATFPRLQNRLRFSRWQLGTFARAPVSFRRMAARAALIPGSGLLDDCARVGAPALVITGEQGLDRVVPVDSTMVYQRLIAGAQHRAIGATGHLGSVTRPEAFAELVRDFWNMGPKPLSRARESTLEREVFSARGGPAR